MKNIEPRETIDGLQGLDSRFEDVRDAPVKLRGNTFKSCFECLPLAAPTDTTGTRIARQIDESSRLDHGHSIPT